MVNPNIERSVDPDFLRTGLIEAKRRGPGELALFASQHFNVEIGMALRSDRWAGAEHWAKRADKSITLDAVIERSETVVIGIDGGGLDDLFGMCVLGRERGTQDWLAWTHAWCHRGVLDRRQTIAQNLTDFEAAGELTIVDDELGDIAQIVGIIADVKERAHLSAVAVDPAGLGEFVDALGLIGLTPENKGVLGAPQGYAMMNAIKTAERKLANGTLKHSGSSLAAWCASNVKIEPTATAIRATKQNTGDLKIDVIMALFDAVTVMALNPGKAPSFELTFV